MLRNINTDVPAYSDTLGTRTKCHCNQSVTVSRGNFLTNPSFGSFQKCHCKWSVTVNGVAVSGDVCIVLLKRIKYLWVPPVFRVGPLQRLVEPARRRPDDVAQELEEALRPGGARSGEPAQVEPVQVAVGSVRTGCLSDD